MIGNFWKAVQFFLIKNCFKGICRVWIKKNFIYKFNLLKRFLPLGIHNEGKKIWKRDQCTDAPTPRALGNAVEDDQEDEDEDICPDISIPISVFNNKNHKVRPLSITAEPIKFTGSRQYDDIVHKNENIKKSKKQVTKNCSKYQIKTGKAIFCQEEKIMKATNEDGDGIRVRSKIYKCLKSPESFDRTIDFERGDFSRKTAEYKNAQSSLFIQQEINAEIISAPDTKFQKIDTTKTNKKEKSSLLEQERHSLDSATMKQRKEEIDIILAFQKAHDIQKSHEMKKSYEHDQSVEADNEYSGEQLSKMIQAEKQLLEEHKVGQEDAIKTETENKLVDNTGTKSAKFLIFGGIDPYHIQPTTTYEPNEINNGRKVLSYNFRLNTWTNIATMPSSKHHHSAVVCNGLIYVIGGTKILNDTQKPVLSKLMWSFNPITLEWQIECNMPYPRRDFVAITNDEQKGFYVIGGEDSDKNVLSSTIFYNVNAKKWEEKAPLKIGRSGLMAIGFTIKNNKIFNPLLPDKDIDQPVKSKNFENITRKKIWAAGGVINLTNSIVTNVIEEYDIYLDKWTKVGQLRIPRCFGKMCLVNNEIYVVGGLTNTNGWKNSLNSMDKYIEESNSWILVGKMKFSRHGHDVLYSNSKIFAVGGVSTIGPTSFYSVECFDTRSKKFLSGFASLPEPLSGLAAVRIDC